MVYQLCFSGDPLARFRFNDSSFQEWDRLALGNSSGDSRSHLLVAKRRIVFGCFFGLVGHPSFVMSCSFTNQVLAQLDLLENTKKNKGYKCDQVYLLPKELDEKVARLHLGALGAEMTSLTKEQADYIGVKVEGPYKPDTYRY